MPTFVAPELIREAGLPATTGWRRLRRLEWEGRVRWERRIGGYLGSRSAIFFAGTREELLGLLQRNPTTIPPATLAERDSVRRAKLRDEAIAIEEGLRRMTGRPRDG